jgi:hypothetical protein
LTKNHTSQLFAGTKMNAGRLRQGIPVEIRGAQILSFKLKNSGHDVKWIEQKKIIIFEKFFYCPLFMEATIELNTVCCVFIEHSGEFIQHSTKPRKACASPEQIKIHMSKTRVF